MYYLLIIGFLASGATLLGGLFALKFKDKLHLILGFSAGAVIGVAFFDLLPEALELGNAYDSSFITSIVAVGFILFMILDRFFIFHSHNNDEHKNIRGQVGAGSLSIHSFLDGMAIGLAFQVSSAVGIIVTIAVLVHDFSDGINTVGLILKNGGNKTEAFKWLIVDSISPIVGILSTMFISVTQNALGIILALFCGFFIYIGASDLLPESHHSHPTAWTTVATILGIIVLYSAIQLAGV